MKILTESKRLWISHARQCGPWNTLAWLVAEAILRSVKTPRMRNLLLAPYTAWTRYREGYQVPPTELIELVAGEPNPVSFIAGARHVLLPAIDRVLHRNSLDLQSFQSILDFGCGCGRILRYWNDPDRIACHGTDVNPCLVAWCQQYLSFAECRVNQLDPPLEYESGTFDFVFAGSVFTHLPESLQHAWLGELARILTDKGHLLLSTHGEHYARQLSQDLYEAFRAGELVTINEEKAGKNRCASFHPERYIRERMCERFHLVDFVPMGFDTQDAVLMMKRNPSPASVEGT